MRNGDDAFLMPSLRPTFIICLSFDPLRLDDGDGGPMPLDFKLSIPFFGSPSSFDTDPLIGLGDFGSFFASSSSFGGDLNGAKFFDLIASMLIPFACVESSLFNDGEPSFVFGESPSELTVVFVSAPFNCGVTSLSRLVDNLATGGGDDGDWRLLTLPGPNPYGTLPSPLSGREEVAPLKPDINLSPKPDRNDAPAPARSSDSDDLDALGSSVSDGLRGEGAFGKLVLAAISSAEAPMELVSNEALVAIDFFAAVSSSSHPKLALGPFFSKLPTETFFDWL